jgi:YVTN family beta-propeller protein
LLLVDLQALKAGESVTTGRGGVKFAKNLGAIAATAASATAASYQASSMAASNGGVGYAPYQIFTVAPANTSISVRPDGAFVYVLNSETNDVTIVNVSTSAVVDKIAAGGQRFQPLNNGGVLGVVGRNTLHLIDTSTQKALQEVHFDKSLEGVYLSPDGRTALAFSEGPLVLLNGSTGEVRGKIDGFKRPRTVVFAQGEQTPNVSTQP